MDVENYGYGRENYVEVFGGFVTLNAIQNDARVHSSCTWHQKGFHIHPKNQRPTKIYLSLYNRISIESGESYWFRYIAHCKAIHFRYVYALKCAIHISIARRRVYCTIFAFLSLSSECWAEHPLSFSLAKIDVSMSFVGLLLRNIQLSLFAYKL